MNRKQFIILLVLVAVVGAAGLFVRHQNRASWKGAATTIGQKLLPNLPVNDIAQITIKAGAGEATLIKRDNLWRVHERGDYPANFSQISDLLLKFADLKVVQSEEIGPSQLGRFELLPPGSAANSGTLVEFKDAGGKVINSVLLGKKHQKKPAGNSPNDEGWPDGRYVMAGVNTRTLAVIADPLDSVQTGPAAWLNKDFLSIENPRAIAVQFPEATNSWKLTRASATNDWQLANAAKDEKLDSTKVAKVTNPFGSPAFNDVAASNPAGQTNATLMTVETFDGFTYVAQIGREQAENYPVSFSIAATIPTQRIANKDEKPEDQARLDKEFKDQQARLTGKLAKEKAFENWTYQLPAYSIDEVLKSRGQLMVDGSTNSPAPAQP